MLTPLKTLQQQESWHHRLAQNLSLRVGEAPNWKTTDFLASDGEDTRAILATARAFIDILQSEVPLHWKTQPNSIYKAFV